MTDLPAPALVWCPFPDADEARAVAGTLLDEGLIACANIVPAMESLYVWNGQRGHACEAGVLFKTNIGQLDNLVARLDVLHSYAQPTILGWRCDAASPAAETWLGGLGN
jgi:periplasmic divalent cation tolerance protein